MRLGVLDWAIVGGFFALNVVIGLAYARRAGGSTSEFFLSGRNVPWWLAGTSMVATTFGADTPLAVTGMVARSGIAGNWLWWSSVASGMLTVFFFAALWRRAGVMTDVELIEIRYAGKSASALRAFRALYLALPVNCMIIGWVNLAMAKILALTLGLPKGPAVAACLLLTALYVSVSGLWGVLVTDVLQFVVKLGMTIVLAIFAVRAAGGMDRLKAALPPAKLAFVPDLDSAWMPALTFAVYIGVQWWAAWYPGAEPGGGGYVAQRIFSAKTEKDGMYATLWFNVAHYTVRSWPWILTALAASVLYGPMEDPEAGYVRVMIDHLPTSLRGLMMAGFLAAYMSTVATHLNWGASYFVGDIYKRFLRPKETDKHYVRVSRLATLATMAVAGTLTLFLDSVAGAWRLMLAFGSGTGLVLILRWYWWRINAWSEIAAMAASFVTSAILLYGVGLDPDEPLPFAYLMLGTLVATTASWLAATFLTRPEPDETLVAFYDRVRPGGPGWRPIAAKSSVAADGPPLPVRARDWILGCVLVYSSLFGVGKWILGQRALGAALIGIAIVSAALLARDLRAATPAR
ncbi:MAG: Na+:solute symporter [Labilithrix sp.]|nr:Na+:solute symporter [Labilithrix sp.]MCW5813682.1 Na+:solute symporter [Labilithrix sp.]